MTTQRPRPKRATAARNVKPTLTREQLLSALEKLRSADEAHAKERRRPMTPSDLRRLGELTTKRRLNADEQQELATLEARFDVDRERRDLGGTVEHKPEGDYYPAGERRKDRTIKAQGWIVARLRPIADAHRNERQSERNGGRKGGLTSGRNRIAKRGDCIEAHRADWERLRKTMKARSAAKILERKTGFDFDSIARHFRTHPTA